MFRYATHEHLRFLFRLLRSGTQRKHAWKWIRSLQPDYLLKAPSPWLTFDAIDFIERRIQPGWRIFEYGSGGSTLFWLNKRARCISVEHDPVWYAVVRNRAGEQSGFDYRLVTPEAVPTSFSWSSADPADPKCYISSAPEYKNMSFRRYVTQIDEFPDHTFDLVLIDGRARPSCVMHAVDKVTPGGLLVLDNSDRVRYTSHTQSLLGDFQLFEIMSALPTLPMYSQTNVYQKTRA